MFGEKLNNQNETEKIENIVKVLKENGYYYVDCTELDEIYDGENKYLQKNNTWWVRYFDYI